jgi:hypothetical protein
VIRAAGLELRFQLANADDDDHDLALIRRSLARSPAERFVHGQRAARKINTLWRDARPVRDDAT